MANKTLNPQLKVAILIAPFLFIIGFIAMEYFAQDDPPGNVLHQLHAVNERCDLSNNDCTFSNADLQISVTLEEQLESGSSRLRLLSQQDLGGVAIALTDIDDDAAPITMISEDDPRQWSVNIHAPLTIFPYLRLVVRSEKGLYFGEAPVDM
ncbi:MAG: hypothetical protein ABFR19_01050 [Pseudomonadota bacterium]